MEQTDLLSLVDRENDDTMNDKYLIFSMGDEMFGMEIRYITEIVGVQSITEVPEMPEHIKGVTNLRGKIIPIMDARLRFKKPERAYDDRTCIVVIDANDIAIGLIVDSVVEVATILPEDIEPLPHLNKRGSKYIKGIGKGEDGIKLLLDCRELLTGDELDKVESLI